MTTVKNYLSLVKFSHTIFAMPFALIGFFLGMMQTSFTLNAKHPLFNYNNAWRFDYKIFIGHYLHDNRPQRSHGF